MFAVTVVAVTKVIVAVCIGAFTCRKIPNASVTIRDFSFIIANILLPSLTFYNTAVSVNAELLLRCSVLIFFAIFVIGLGLICAIVSSKVLYPVKNTGIPHELRHCLRYTLIYQNAEGRRASKRERRLNRRMQKQQEEQQPQQQQQQRGGVLLRPVVCIVVSGELEEQRVEPEEVLPLIEPPGVEYEEEPFYRYATMVACSVQNSVTLPLSLLQALATSLVWIDLAAGTSYIFIYSVLVTAYFWAAGPAMIERGKKETHKRRTIRQLLELHKKLQHRRDVSTQTVLRRESSRMTSPNYPMSLPMPIPIRSISTPPPPPLSSSSSSFSSSAAAAIEEKTEREKRGEEVSVRSVAVMDNSSQAGPAMGIEVYSTGEQANLSTGLDQGPLLPARGFCETFAYDWRKRGLIRVVYSREFKDETDVKPTITSLCAVFLHAVKSTGLRLLQTLAFTSVVAGVVVGVIPPLRWLVFEGPLSMVMDSIALVAQGSIPSSLLLLGSNLAGGSSQTTAEAEVRLREAEQNTEFPLDDETEEPKYVEMYNAAHKSIEFDEHASFTLMGLQQEEQRQRERQLQQQQQSRDNQRGSNGVATTTTSSSSSSEGNGMFQGILDILSLDGLRKSFVFGVLFIRLLLIPAIGFILVLGVRAVFPSLFGGAGGHDVLLLVLLGELAAPSAINCALLFNASQYYPVVWAKMMFYQYICCTLSFVLWCTLSLYIAG